jgi:hypothetical protein
MSTKTTNQAPQQAEEREIEGAVNIYRIVQELWERAGPELSEKELEWFAGCSGYAEMYMELLSDTVEKIGCYIAADKDLGCYDDKRAVYDLLFFIAESARCGIAMSITNRSATNLIRYRRFAV